MDWMIFSILYLNFYFLLKWDFKIDQWVFKKILVNMIIKMQRLSNLVNCM